MCKANGFAAGRLFVAIGAAMVLSAGGCATITPVRTIPDVADFQGTVLQADRPVLVEFYKDNCPTCVIQEAVLQDLMPVYAGKVDFVRFKIREATMAGASPEIMERYKLFWVPTVVLFANGQEKQRWVFNHPATDFYVALNEAVNETSRRPRRDAIPSTALLPPKSPAPAGSAGDRPGQSCTVVRVP